MKRGQRLTKGSSLEMSLTRLAEDANMSGMAKELAQLPTGKVGSKRPAPREASALSFVGILPLCCHSGKGL